MCALADELALPRRIFDLDDANRVAEGLEGVSAVLHCAGPFSRTSGPLAAACLETRTHYLDITGEVEVFEALAARGGEAEEAGVTLFGPVVNVKTNQSSPWNLARVITFVKACCDVAQIPIHANMGMGVGGVPVTNHPPVDITTRASAAMVEICRLDGL